MCACRLRRCFDVFMVTYADFWICGCWCGRLFGFGVVDLVWDGSQRCCLFVLVVGVVCLHVCVCVVGCCLLYLVLVWAVFSGCVWWWLLCNLFCSLALLGVDCVVIF